MPHAEVCLSMEAYRAKSTPPNRQENCAAPDSFTRGGLGRCPYIGRGGFRRISRRGAEFPIRRSFRAPRPRDNFMRECLIEIAPFYIRSNLPPMGECSQSDIKREILVVEQLTGWGLGLSPGALVVAWSKAYWPRGAGARIRPVLTLSNVVISAASFL